MSNDIKMSTTAWKTERDLCRCCHSEGAFKSLYTPYFWFDAEEIVYSNVLRECFNIELLDMRDPSQHLLCTICYNCIQRLEDAVKFRRQILKCETRFRDIYDVYSGCVDKDPSFEVPVKQEPLDAEESILLEPTSFNGVSDGDSNAADDGAMLNHADGDYKSNDEGTEEDSFLRERTKVVKYKKKKKTPAKVKKKDKVEKKPEPISDEVLSTIAGVINVVKRLTVKPDVDYKQTDDGFQCTRCQLTVKSRNAVRDHIRTVHLNIPKYKCPNCSEHYTTVATFTKHKLEKHDIDHRFKCNACENAFNTKIQLKKHINTFHMLGEKIKCTECDYETFSVESMYKHKFKHKTVKDYQCKFCRKAFVRKTTLQLHERIHTGDRRKVCAVCGQAFVQKASLNYHMSKYHPEVVF